jgi:hypothetical protein
MGGSVNIAEHHPRRVSPQCALSSRVIQCSAVCLALPVYSTAQYCMRLCCKFCAGELISVKSMHACTLSQTQPRMVGDVTAAQALLNDCLAKGRTVPDQHPGRWRFCGVRGTSHAGSRVVTQNVLLATYVRTDYDLAALHLATLPPSQCATLEIWSLSACSSCLGSVTSGCCSATRANRCDCCGSRLTNRACCRSTSSTLLTHLEHWVHLHGHLATAPTRDSGRLALCCLHAVERG